MVVLCTTMAVAMSRMLGSVGRSGPVRERLVRNMKDWAYSKKAITLDILVNMIIVVVSAVFLDFTVAEKPNVPLRVWVVGYAVQCLVHAILVWSEYRRRARRSKIEIDLESVINGHGDVTVYVRVGNDDRIVVAYFSNLWVHVSFAYRYDSLNVCVSMVWTVLGFCWVLSDDKLLSQNAPWLYWLTMVFQNYDFTFVAFYVTGIAVWLSLSRIIAILNIVAGQKGASEKDVNVLPKFRSYISSNGEKLSVGAGVTVPMDFGSGDFASECVLLPEDSEFCICHCSNDDGKDLHALSRNHRFQATCIEKWLESNATGFVVTTFSKYEFEHASNSLFTV